MRYACSRACKTPRGRFSKSVKATNVHNDRVVRGGGERKSRVSSAGRAVVTAWPQRKNRRDEIVNFYGTGTTVVCDHSRFFFFCKTFIYFLLFLFHHYDAGGRHASGANKHPPCRADASALWTCELLSRPNGAARRIKRTENAPRILRFRYVRFRARVLI